jgi:hypothetical protein
MSVKVFDRKLYNECDTFGKTVAKKFMTQEGYMLVNEDEAYKSHDLIFGKDQKETKVEVEINRRWQRRYYPYATVTVPYRKRFSKADLYIMISKNGEALLTVPMKDVLRADTIVKDTCFTTQERFFSLPISSVKLYYLQDGCYYPIETEDDSN